MLHINCNITNFGDLRKLKTTCARYRTPNINARNTPLDNIDLLTLLR